MFEIFEYLFNIFRFFPPIFNAMIYVMGNIMLFTLYDEGYLINEMFIFLFLILTVILILFFRRLANIKSNREENILFNRFNS